MPKKLALTLACGDYEIIRPLLKGKVEVDGVDLTILTDMDSATRHWRFLNKGEFDIAEVSASSYLAARDNDLPFRAIPVFLHRRFRHGFMFINTTKGIKKPADLKGRKIGVKTMMTTAVLWMRGMLAARIQRAADGIEWVAEIKDDVEVSLPPDIKYPACRTTNRSRRCWPRASSTPCCIPTSSSRSSPRIRAWRVSSPTTKRKRSPIINRTGIFPIMHVVGLRKSLAEEHPWLAVNLFGLSTRQRRSR